jgi:hypothetical protein
MARVALEKEQLVACYQLWRWCGPSSVPTRFQYTPLGWMYNEESPTRNIRDEFRISRSVPNAWKLVRVTRVDELGLAVEALFKVR